MMSSSNAVLQEFIGQSDVVKKPAHQDRNVMFVASFWSAYANMT